jgi:uncharacterized protein DUF397
LINTQLSNPWRRSTRCDTNACVEVARTASGMAIRDSERPAGPILEFTNSVWSNFIGGIRAGDFD